MANFGIKSSAQGINVITVSKPHQLAFTSAYSLHKIRREGEVIEASKVDHALGYRPFYLHFANAGGTPLKKQRIEGSVDSQQLSRNAGASNVLAKNGYFLFYEPSI